MGKCSFALYRNLKSIDSQLLNLETEQHIQSDKVKQAETNLKMMI